MQTKEAATAVYIEGGLGLLHGAEKIQRIKYCGLTHVYKSVTVHQATEMVAGLYYELYGEGKVLFSLFSIKFSQINKRAA